MKSIKKITKVLNNIRINNNKKLIKNKCYKKKFRPLLINRCKYSFHIKKILIVIKNNRKTSNNIKKKRAMIMKILKRMINKIIKIKNNMKINNKKHSNKQIRNKCFTKEYSPLLINKYYCNKKILVNNNSNIKVLKAHRYKILLN